MWTLAEYGLIRRVDDENKLNFSARILLHFKIYIISQAGVRQWKVKGMDYQKSAWKAPQDSSVNSHLILRAWIY